MGILGSVIFYGVLVLIAGYLLEQLIKRFGADFLVKLSIPVLQGRIVLQGNLIRALDRRDVEALVDDVDFETSVSISQWSEDEVAVWVAFGTSGGGVATAVLRAPAGESALWYRLSLDWTPLLILGFIVWIASNVQMSEEFPVTSEVWYVVGAAFLSYGALVHSQLRSLNDLARQVAAYLDARRKY